MINSFDPCPCPLNCEDQATNMKMNWNWQRYKPCNRNAARQRKKSAINISRAVDTNFGNFSGLDVLWHSLDASCYEFFMNVMLVYPTYIALVYPNAASVTSTKLWTKLMLSVWKMLMGIFFRWLSSLKKNESTKDEKKKIHFKHCTFCDNGVWCEVCERSKIINLRCFYSQFTVWRKRRIDHFILFSLCVVKHSKKKKL